MKKRYLGRLPERDPLHSYLRHEIMPQIGGRSHPASFRVFQLRGSNDVYLYEERHSGTRVVGKFFLSERKRDPAKAARRMAREFNNLKLLRSYHLDTPPHYVVRPLGCNESLNCVVFVEYCEGESLSDIIQAALFRDGGGCLFRKLTALAYFLATLHNRTAEARPVDFQEDCAYMDRLAGMLLRMRMISHDKAMELNWLRDQWRSQERMWQDRQVLVHGDATPDNFLFGEGLDVIALDVERAKRADRVFDVGRVAGELKHFFMQATGERSAAEPYIGHFLWEYSCHFPDRMQAFHSVTGRIPFHIGMTLLRIARNTWIEPAHRRQLIEEAKNNLRRFA
jgi:aminoglycoside phosphotransferase (APT) family kinase protein